MTLPTLYDRLFTLETEKEALYKKLHGPARQLYSRAQLREYWLRWRKLIKQIKQIKIDIQTHPNYERKSK